MVRGRMDAMSVTKARSMGLRDALELLGVYVGTDRDFQPQKDLQTARWIVSVPTGEFELLVTGAKWFDTRQARGGGGAIDLVMHVLGLSFFEAVKRLVAASEVTSARTG